MITDSYIFIIHANQGAGSFLMFYGGVEVKISLTSLSNGESNEKSPMLSLDLMTE